MGTFDVNDFAAALDRHGAHPARWPQATRGRALLESPARARALRTRSATPRGANTGNERTA